MRLDETHLLVGQVKLKTNTTMKTEKAMIEDQLRKEAIKRVELERKIRAEFCEHQRTSGKACMETVKKGDDYFITVFDFPVATTSNEKEAVNIASAVKNALVATGVLA